MDYEKAAFNALSISLESNYRKLLALLQKHGSWLEAWKNFEPKNLDMEKAWESLDEAGINLVLANEAAFPALLKEMPWPPLALYFKGNLSASADALAIVGTRRATPDGKAQAKRFAADLAKRNITIVSGLALGIDSAAHEGALSVGGKTIAVLGSGLDSIYPKTNWQLAQRILETEGAIVSEYPPGTPALPHHFLERNRIVSGLSMGVLIIEAPDASGTLATARFASDQNRDIFVLPGPANHPNFAGSHSLIRLGAELVTDPKHILEAFGLTEAKGKEYKPEDEYETAILAALRESGPELEIDKIIELTNLNAQKANQTATLLLMKEVIEECQGGYRIRP